MWHSVAGQGDFRLSLVDNGSSSAFEPRLRVDRRDFLKFCGRAIQHHIGGSGCQRLAAP